jgi:hypothetical protein
MAGAPSVLGGPILVYGAATIQAAIDDAVVQNKGGILIPAGTYRVSRATTTPGRWSLDLKGVQDFAVRRGGPGSGGW